MYFLNHLVYVKRDNLGRGNLRVARLYDSPNLEEQEVEFVITNGGIADPKNED